LDADRGPYTESPSVDNYDEYYDYYDNDEYNDDHDLFSVDDDTDYDYVDDGGGPWNAEESRIVEAGRRSDDDDSLSIPLGAASLVFVFDVTGSMHDDLVQVIEGAARILATTLAMRDKPLYNYVLVPFHDPGQYRSPAFFIYTSVGTTRFTLYVNSLQTVLCLRASLLSTI